MLRLATGRPDQPIRVVNDQYGSPTWARRLAMQIGALIMSGKGGTYHATSEGWCTWYELAVFFLETMGIRREVLPISTNEYPTAARRPKNSILENSRLKEEGINVMVDWREDVMEFSRRAGKLLILEAQGGR
ncbi:MAG: dTDP-4-dehydrorhamnose reductase, partial [Deltaproteobacteria bacterium CG17_big_fil_post_rev_8_21_14_2_50_51_6]